MSYNWSWSSRGSGSRNDSGLSLGTLETTFTVTTLIGEKTWGIMAVEVDITEHGGGTIVGLIVQLNSIRAY